jgi:MoaA/NifB/PqqE/SkfB family radical SAM enzyme
MSIEEIKKVVPHFAQLGTKAVTLIGGGEPTVHKNFNEMVQIFIENNIKVGMVSNGIKFPKAIKYMDWVRISSSDERILPEVPVNKFPSVDWAYSYVLTDNVNIENLINHILFAEKNNFTHIRIVRDLLDVQDNLIEEVKEKIKYITDKVSLPIIWQDRRPTFQHGENPCLVSLLRPLLTADGTVYPCCSIQYAVPEPQHNLDSNYKMCHWTEYNSLNPFDGSICIRCSYGRYNEVLKKLSNNSIHKEFL